MTKEITYYDVLSLVSKWAKEKKAIWIKRGIAVSISEMDAISIDFDFPNCLAKIVVEDAGFAPYRYVSFEALFVDGATESSGLLCHWYDDNSTSLETIILELEKGIEYCLFY